MAPGKAASKWWAVPYVLGVVILGYLVIGTTLGGQIYGGISIALSIWFFMFCLYTLIHLVWLKIRRRRSAESQSEE
jgi:uncharacterized membrane protein YhaH (DUF805 family)